ncbi:hypothetical protein BBO99_00008732 [Phytophthora kernoviae]|uniref:Cytochrome P450 n=2 Tax=Phytophthora kernoviae TaxID=325452 RepID=A0A3R7J667_9STRA|nr:hypothetical protein G195_010185 [Phytophthora kernoviae 00238/432]RLN10228.1 hypothetical protein BBI17_008542 [Phytophthora kernoviae]RLN74809.1 hypothetical protein BBO99_00008732 [Phytophthora kernoviae]
MTTDQISEGSPEFHDWLFATTKRFHGKPWLLHVPGRPDVLVLSSPQLFEDIQRTFALQFEKVDNQFEGLGLDVHGNAVASVSSAYLRPSLHIQRHLAATVLTSPVLREMASDLVSKHVESLVKIFEDAAGDSKLESCIPLDVTKLMRQFAMEVFAELGFGLQLGTLRSSSRDSSHVDMVDILLKQKQNSKNIKDPGFLAEFVLGFVVAARDSMAYTLSMCFQCLAQHPEEQEKLYQELKEGEESEVAMDVYGMARRENVWGLGSAEFHPQRWIDVKTDPSP